LNHPLYAYDKWAVVLHVKGKGKAIPLQGWAGPEDCRRLRLPDFKTIGTLRW
jgi:hypothetical protein